MNATKLIAIGMNTDQKKEIIRKYLSLHKDVKHIVYFRQDKMGALAIEADGVDVEKRTWSDAIMYRYFYPLLEKIDDRCLIIYDEMMRTQKRNDLTYNCCHKYSNQTKHIIVFNYFPMIEDKDDFMILIDLAYPDIYRGRACDTDFLQMDGVTVVPRMVEITSEHVYQHGKVPEDINSAYQEEKENLFDSLDDGKDPDTVVRALHVWCGTHCKKELSKHITERMLARNARFKNQNVIKWTDNEPAGYILDFPVRRLQFTDYIRNSGVERLTFLTSGLTADKYYFNDYQQWLERLGNFYVEASI